MGCSPLKSQRKDHSKPRISLLKLRGTSLISRYSTVNLIETTTKDLQFISAKCLKFRIFNPNPKFALQALDMEKTQLKAESIEVQPVLNDIRLLYSEFSTAVSCFYSEVHEQCIPNFFTSKALEVMMISLVNNDKAKMKLSKNKPFVEVFDPVHEKTSKILTVWVQLVQAIDDLNGPKLEILDKAVKKMKEFQEKVDEYSQFVLKPVKYVKASKVLASCIETYQRIVSEAQRLLSDIHRFFEKVSVKNIEKRIKLFKVQSCYSGKKIVHCLYSSQIEV